MQLANGYSVNTFEAIAYHIVKLICIVQILDDRNYDSAVTLMFAIVAADQWWPTVPSGFQWRDNTKLSNKTR